MTMSKVLGFTVGTAVAFVAIYYIDCRMGLPFIRDHAAIFAALTIVLFYASAAAGRYIARR